MTTISSLGVNVAVLIALAVISPALATELEAIDENGYEVPDKLDFCKLEDERISHISTIKKIIEKYESLPGPGPCRHHWLYPLDQLKDIFAETEKDACSMVAVEKIEAFHWDYIVRDISETWKINFKRNEFSTTQTPTAVQMFFMHFVDQLLDKCESTLGERLELVVRGGNNFQANSLNLAGSWGERVDFMAKALIEQSRIKNYDDFFLPYMTVSTRDKKDSGNPLMIIKMRDVGYSLVTMVDPSKPEEARTKCIHNLRPIYYNTVLPVMRLIDLGYGQKNRAFTDNKELLANWYRITQVCQLIIPVTYAKDASGGTYTPVYTDAEPPSVAGETPQDAEVRPVQLADDTIPAATDDRVLSRIKSNFKTRTNFYKRAHKNMFSNQISGLGSKIKDAFSCGSKCANDGE